MKTKKNIYKDRKGRDYIKEAYFVGGKMKFRKVYVIDGIPVEEFYEKNETDTPTIRITTDFYDNSWITKLYMIVQHFQNLEQYGFRIKKVTF